MTDYTDTRRFIGGVFIVMSVLLLVVLVADGLGAEEIPLRELRGRDYEAARDVLRSLDARVGQIENMTDRLGYRLQPGPDTDREVAALAQHGDDAVSEMERRLVDGDVDRGWGHDAVRVLKEINTEKARLLLRRLALGEFNEVDANQDWAASRLIACDRSEASNLLVSTNPEVLVTAINAMEGQPIDDKLMVLLKKCLGNKDALVSCSTATLLAAGTSGELALEAIEAIGKAVTAVADLPDVNVLQPFQSRSSVTEQTLGEGYYFAYAGALVKAQVDDRTLHNLAKQLQGQAKNAVILALAWRGDKSVREELVKLIQDTQAGLLRARAVTALNKIGTPDDLPFLRTLAKNDPLTRKGALLGAPSRGPGDVRVGTTYPVREAANDAIRSIEAREGK